MADTSKGATAFPHSPQDCDRLFGERLNAGDLDGLVALYERSGTLVRADRTAAVGHEAIAEDVGAMRALRPQIVMNVKQVFSGGGDVAVLYNDWQLVLTDPEGKRIELSGHAAEIIRRQSDGTWRFVIDDPYARDAG
jgi:ketosteroid isomerase-like protein